MSGAPMDSELGLCKETLLELELGFKSLLIELDPTTYNSETAAPIGRAIRASDLAFPTGNNVYDHSPNAPFRLDEQKLRNAPAPAGHKELRGGGLQDIADPAAYAHRQLAEPAMALLAFGTAEVYAFVMCDMGTRAWLRAHPLFAAQLHTEPHASAFAFRRASFADDGRGEGLVAARRIKKGECVLREPPLLVCVQAWSAELVGAFDQATGHMHPRARAALDALHDCHAHDPPALRIPGASPRVGKVRTNAVAVGFPTATSELGAVFEIVSRFNHSCAPNVDFEWSYKDFQASIWAARDIEPGEELTMSYLSDIDAPRETRRAELFKKYRFNCACEKCGPL